ncbi:MAG: hypothetical protein E7H38_07905 [Varibaculum cambriense]|uniref:terminase small subunit n=1 Tax=Varibaculum cambriense TaxID=184870 RepID=UPI00290E836E|nr:hypothetical protein [Varibaculum cambriense]MDU4028278.1 hypothetical protein [Varibaculum cambriense]
MNSASDKNRNAEKRREKEVLEAKARGMAMAGANFDEIADKLGITPARARQVTTKALTRKAPPTTEQQRKMDYEILRGLSLRLHKAAMGDPKKEIPGDTAAAKLLLEVLDRMAALSAPVGDSPELEPHFEKTVTACAGKKGLHASGEDAALVASGRKIAHHIDEVFRTGSQLEKTKALYLMPHLKGILTDMLATPAARAQAEAIAKDKGEAAEATALGKMRASRDRIRLVKTDSEQAG